MKRQRALHLMVSATIALSIGECSVVAASSDNSSRGGGSTSSSSLSSAAAGGRPISRAKFPPSSTKTTALGRDSLRPNGSGTIGGGREKSSLQSSRRRAVDILNLDVDDDSELLRGGYSPGDLGDDVDVDVDSPLRELEDFDYETGGGMIDDDDFDMDGLIDLDGDEEEFLPSSEGKEDDSDNEYGQGSEKGALYDAYNLLHSLAQVRFICRDQCYSSSLSYLWIASFVPLKSKIRLSSY